MTRCRLAASEVTLAVKTLTTSEGTTEWGVHQSLVETLREALVEEFGRKVLADKIRPDPPNRGKNCVVHIVVKQGAQSKKQRAMQLSGERLKAMEDVIAEWLAEKKIEDGKGPRALHTRGVSEIHEAQVQSGKEPDH